MSCRQRSVPLCAALLVSVVAPLVTACAKNAKQSAAKDLTPEERKAADDYAAEVEIGRNMAGRLLGYYGIIDDPNLIGYLNQIGNYVASYGDYPDRRYMFAILKHESVNAFACPGGYILITAGAIRNATNEAELAAILGHEVAHVGKKHMFDTLKRMKEEDLAKASKKRTDKEASDPVMKAHQRPIGEETGAGAMLARYLSGSAGASLNILQAAQAGMTLITEQGLGPKLEFEADQEGVKYAIRAGYHPKALAIYLARLKKKSDADKEHAKEIANLGKTHPSFEDRITRINELLKTMKADEITGATGNARFDKMRATMPKPET